MRAETSLKHRSKDKNLKRPRPSFYCVKSQILTLTRITSARNLSVGLGNTLQLILLLDSITVGAALGRVDQLVTEALSDRLDVPEGGFSGASAEEPDCLVDPPQGRDINCLPSDCAGATNSGAVFPGTRVDDRIDHHLDTGDVKY